MKLILMGSSDWVVPVFNRIADEHDIIAVFTRAPKPAERKMQLQKSPVQVWADARGLEVITDISKYNYKPDFNIVASYGVILRDNILSAAPTINIHPSLLPKYRGPAPMLSAIINGDIETGVCLMDVIKEVDAGDIHMMKKISITEDETNEDLEKKVSELSADMLSEYLKNPAAYPAVPQIGIPTYTKKLSPTDKIIDWDKSPRDIHNLVRAIGGRTKINGIDLKILKTRINDGQLLIDIVQPAGKNPMDWKSFVNGLRGAQIKFGK